MSEGVNVQRRRQRHLLAVLAATLVIASVLPIMSSPSSAADAAVVDGRGYVTITNPGVQDKSFFDVTVGPDGRLWFAGFAGITAVEPVTGQTEAFPVTGGATTIIPGPDGRLWFEHEFQTTINSIDPSPPHNIKTFSLDTYPGGLTADTVGNIWFSERNANKIGRLNPVSGAIDLFAIPTPIPTDQGSFSEIPITTGPDGNVWFAEKSANKIGVITPTGTISEFSIPTTVSDNASPPHIGSSKPNLVVSGPDGWVWFNELDGHKVGRINPATHDIVEFPNIDVFAATRRPNDPNLWFSGRNGSTPEILRVTHDASVTRFDLTLDMLGGIAISGITSTPDGRLWFAPSRSAAPAVYGRMVVPQDPPPAPTITNLDPPQSSAQGGSKVKINGNGLAGGMVTIGGFPAVSTTESDSQIIVTTPPAAVVGAVPVTVTTPGTPSGGGVATSSLTYTAAGPAPAITGIAPANATGSKDGGTEVVLTGENLAGTTAVRFGNANAESITVDSPPTTLHVITPPGSPGTVPISVTTPGGVATAPFNYLYSDVPPPIVHEVDIVGGAVGAGAAGMTANIKGTGLSGANAVTFGGVSASDVTVVNDQSVTATVPPGSGTVHVQVTTTLGGTSAPGPKGFDDAFTYLPAPVVTGVSPNSGRRAGGDRVTITGTGFVGNRPVVKFGTAPATRIRLVSDTVLEVTSPPGQCTVDVTVTGDGGTSTVSDADKFTYQQGTSSPPIVTAVSPTSGRPDGGDQVTITGCGFAGTTGVSFGPTPAQSVEVAPANDEITAISPPGTGPVAVSVTTANGTSSTTIGPANRFTYGAPPSSPPVVSGLAPTSGKDSGGTKVTISGSHFTGMTAVKFGTTAAQSFEFVSDSSVTAITPPGVGTVDVTVTNAQGTSAAVAEDKFTYILVPAVTGLAPSSGKPAGGTVVAVTGRNFTGTTEVKFGSKSALAMTVDSDSQITATSPPGTGTVHVTVKGEKTSEAVAADRFTYEASSSGGGGGGTGSSGGGGGTRSTGSGGGTGAADPVLPPQSLDNIRVGTSSGGSSGTSSGAASSGTSSRGDLASTGRSIMVISLIGGMVVAFGALVVSTARDTRPRRRRT